MTPTTTKNAVTTPAIAAIDTNEVFNALQTFINQRPGLDARDYGHGREGLAAYRAELRTITADKKRAIAALDEARGIYPAQPELLRSSFTHAFSGRLEWKPYPVCDIKGDTGHEPTGRLEYTTGQYFPTEYRKAAATVLETYVTLCKQADAATTQPTFTYQTIADVKAANRAIGNNWFDRGSMRYFNTVIESGLIGGKYFITSERMDTDRAKEYSIRLACSDGSIDTVGEFQAYKTLSDARKAVPSV